MRQRAGRTRGWVKLAAALGVLVVLGGCGSSSGGDASSARDEQAAGGAAPERAPAQDEAPADKPNEKVGGAERSLVYVGGISLRVEDVTKAADSASRLATTHGGFVAGDNRRASGDDDGDGRNSYAELVLRVPSAKFGDTVDALAKLGQELERTRKVEDVTKVVLDLDSRIASQQASVNRVRQLMARAEDINQIVSLERELAQRESDLASLLARKRNLTDQVALSTITVNLYGPRAEYTAKKPERGFFAGLSAGWQAFKGFVVILLTVFGALLPFLVALAVVLTPLLWYVRRRRRHRAVPPTAGGDTPPSGTSPPNSPSGGAAPLPAPVPAGRSQDS